MRCRSTQRSEKCWPLRSGRVDSRDRCPSPHHPTARAPAAQRSAPPSSPPRPAPGGTANRRVSVRKVHASGPSAPRSARRSSTAWSRAGSRGTARAGRFSSQRGQDRFAYAHAGSFGRIMCRSRIPRGTAECPMTVTAVASPVTAEALVIASEPAPGPAAGCRTALRGGAEYPRTGLSVLDAAMAPARGEMRIFGMA
jgi:hypothetical protein